MRAKSGLRRALRDTNFILLALCTIASAFGLLMVHSATLRHVAEGSVISRNTLVMAAAIALGLVACLVISFIDYTAITKLWPVVGAVAVLLMLSLFIFGEPPEGREDAISWIRIGGLSFQPSELVKIGFVITFAMHLNHVSDTINKPLHILLLGLHGLIPTGLVIATGDLGSALVFMAIMAGMMFVGGVHLRYFGIAVALIGAAAPILWTKVFSSYQKDRFLAVYYPQGMSGTNYTDIIYQQQQGVNAIGSGRLFGKGLFQGDYTQRGLVPVNESDMIFSVVGEELGFLGAIFLILLLGAIVVCIAFSARKSRDPVGSLLCYGIMTMIGAQTIINIGMCMKLLPCIGITLPFISYGGSSSLCIYLGIGLVMSVYRFNREQTPVDFRLRNIRTPFSA